MEVTGQITFKMEFSEWEKGWKILNKLCKIVDETKVVGEIGSMGFR